jgi:hypothetical protein
LQVRLAFLPEVSGLDRERSRFVSLPSIDSAAVLAIAKPVIDALLGPSARFDRAAGLDFANQGLGLPSLDSLGEKLLAERIHVNVLILDHGAERQGEAARRACLFEAGQPVRQLPTLCARPHKLPAAASSLTRGNERMLKTIQFAYRGFKRYPALFFFQIPNAEQPA